MPRPFGRSLDPLPEEDLGGYILRLSAHLCMSPVTLARRLGLVDDIESMITRRILIRSNLDEFAHLARLEPGEARALTLLNWEGCYQPIATARALPFPHRRTGPTHAWLYAGTLRHCPSCLAGDSSEIQAKYGGAWKRIWRLSIAFACIEHRLFLSEGCGSEHAPRLGQPLLIPSVAVSGLHPAQCRQPRPQQHGRASQPCGNRLDQLSTTVTTPPGSAYPDAQRQILEHLQPDTDPERARRFFIDLRLVAAGLNLLAAEHWAAVSAEVHDAVKDTIGRYEQPARTTVDRAPSDVASTATTLTAALVTLESAERQTQLAHLLYETTPTQQHYRLWALAKNWRSHATTCTPEVLDALRRGAATYYIDRGPT